jgi:hypothetical protein
LSLCLAGAPLAFGPAALAAAPAAPVAAPPAPAPTPRVVPRWEYKVITYNRVALLGDSEAELKLLGYQGWELVSAFYDPNARTIVAFLKRPL